MRLLRQPVFLAVAFSHLVVDILNGQIGLLLAVLSGPLRLSYANIGLVATAYSLTGAIMQPVFGLLADRLGSRWLAAGGVLWMAGFFALAAVTPGYWPLACLVAASLGSAAFHPPGTLQAARAGARYMAGRVATAASIFFLFGQSGLAAGPVVGGVLLEHLGKAGLLLATALALPVGLYSAWALQPAAVLEPARPAEGARPALRLRPNEPDWAAFRVVITLAGLRTWAQAVTTTFAPKFFQDQGAPPTQFGAIVACFMAGSAIGGVAGGVISDRWGRRWTVAASLALSILPFFFFPIAQGAWIYGLAVLAGFFNGAPHSIFVALAQRALPGRAAFASGLTLGLMFTAGALGAYLGGLAADQVGLGVVLQGNALLALAGAALSLVLPDKSDA